MMSEGAVLDWGALHLRGSLEVGPGLAATGFAAFSASMAASRFSGDWLRGRMGSIALVRWSGSLAAVGIIVALISPSPLVAIAGFAAVGLGLANLVPVFFGAAGRIPGQTPGAAIAALATIGYAGFLVGPPVIGFVADATSLTLALGLIVLACAAIAVAANIVEPAQRVAPAVGTSGALIDVVVADDVVLAEIIAELHLDHLDVGVAEILQPVAVALADVDRLAARHRLDAGRRR